MASPAGDAASCSFIPFTELPSLAVQVGPAPCVPAGLPWAS